MKWKSIHLLGSVWIALCGQGLYADHVPNPPEDSLILETMRGLILSGSFQPEQKIPWNKEGIHFIDIAIPGEAQDLERLLKRHVGKPLSTTDLTKIKQEIILYYRDHQHPLVTVFIPEQKISYGVILLVVEESVLDEIQVYGNKHFSAEQYRSAIQIEPGEVIDEHRVLNNLNFLNRNPFRRVDLIYAPGEEPATTDIELIVSDKFPLNVYAGVDNTGLVHTNQIRWFAGGTWGNVFNLDQILSLQYTAAPDPHQFSAITLSYTIPLPVQHILLFYGGYSEINVHLPQSSRTNGTSWQTSVRYDIPIAPSPWLLHEISWGFDFKRSNNTVAFVETFPVIGQEVNLTQFTFGYNLGYERNYPNWSHKVGFDLELFFSPFSWIPDQSKMDFQTLNPFANPTYIYGRTSLNYKIQLPEQFQWSILCMAQLSNQSLLPIEQMGLGGFNTVRGYEERQLNGDDGILLSTEIRSPPLHFIPKSQKHRLTDRFECLLFLDWGLAHDNYRLPGETQTAYLMGVGPGIRYAIENYLSARLDWGYKIRRDHFPGGPSMIHFSVIGSF